ncbi:hypothetical protein SynSYN20_01577 [Synechococcus sp. SYN20]|uniref:hypothetical protein n=1 Tax=Synechococcus sp. SYN20 TaxID=1050714 RepID=UPI00164778F9|nr:hypothetical protein [Synechococcus sp. SYN20]QNJ25904.1 hypothetical protein SynSYN20_01577 [Synechococcus sp. SYN20]
MTKSHQTQIKLTREDILGIIDALRCQEITGGADAINGWDPERFLKRLDRALDRLP